MKTIIKRPRVFSGLARVFDPVRFFLAFFGDSECYRDLTSAILYQTGRDPTSSNRLFRFKKGFSGSAYDTEAFKTVTADARLRSRSS